MAETSDAIRKQVEGIQQRGFKRLKELSIIVLLLEVAVFISLWCAVFDSPIPNSQLSAALKYFLGVLGVSLLFLIGIVYYFWNERNKPQFCALFIKPEGDGTQVNKEQGDGTQVNKEHFLRLIMLALGISTGLAFTTLGNSLSPGGWWSSEHGVWWSFEHSIVPYFPLISVVFVCALLYFIYRIRKERIRSSVSWLLFIPISISIIDNLYEMSDNAYIWYISASYKMAPAPGSTGFAVDVIYFGFMALFLASFIILFYLLYQLNVDYRKIHAPVAGEYLLNLIEEGVWILPKRVRVNNTYSTSLSATLSKEFKERASHRYCSYTSDDYLEAEIQAIGLNVRDNERLRVSENPQLPTAWVFSFAKSGIHTINLMINLVKPHNNSKDIVFMQTHNVKVDSFLSASLPPALGFISPIIVTAVQTWLKAVVDILLK